MPILMAKPTHQPPGKKKGRDNEVNIDGWAPDGAFKTGARLATPIISTKFQIAATIISE